MQKYLSEKIETKNMSSLEKAKLEVYKENPDLPMQLKFEVSPRETIEKLLTVEDLTLPSKSAHERNIVGGVYDQVLSKLSEHGFSNIEIIRGSSVVPAKDNFDSLLFSAGNPGRSSTYTRYVDEDHVLRTHTSALIPETFRNLKDLGDRKTFVLPGLVYRRDVIDPRHLDVFHQIDIWTLQKNELNGVATREDLLKLAKTVFEAACPGAEMIVYEAKHPYTVDGIEVYAKVNNKEIEVFEAGLVHPEVLKLTGLNPQEYSGLALGMGVERLIMARKNLPDIRLIRSVDPRVVKQMKNLETFKDVSNQPPMARDMSYCIDKNETEEDVCEAIRNVFGDKSDLLEQVEILQRTPFENLNPIAAERLGAKQGQDNVLVRIILRHPDKTLTKKESADLYSMAYPKLHQGITKGYEVK
jgi:phenylalanyl-tRNA synthetase alpha chain